MTRTASILARTLARIAGTFALLAVYGFLWFTLWPGTPNLAAYIGYAAVAALIARACLSGKISPPEGRHHG